MYRALVLIAFLLTASTARAQPQALLGRLLDTARNAPHGQYGFTMEVKDADSTTTLSGTVQFERLGDPMAEEPTVRLRVQMEDGLYVTTPDGAWSYSDRVGKTYVDPSGEELSSIFALHLLNPHLWPLAGMLPMLASDTLWTEPEAACTFVRGRFSQLDGLNGLHYCVTDGGELVAYEMEGVGEEGPVWIRVALSDFDTSIALSEDDFVMPADVPVVQMNAYGASFLAIGAAAPAFSLSTTGGYAFTLAEATGDVVLIDFWGTWCAPCLTAIDDVEALHTQYGPQGLRVVGVSSYESDEADPAGTAQARGATYAIALGGETIADAYGVTGFPTYYVIGRDGTVRYAAYHPEGDYTELRAAIEAALAE